MPAKGSVIFQATTAEESDGYHFRDPVRIYQALRMEDVPDVLEAAEEASQNGCFVAGYVAYEAGAAFEKAIPRRSIDIPYAWFAVYERAERISRADIEPLMSPVKAEITRLRFSVPKPRYRKQVAAIRELIHEGDVYQINYTGQLRFDCEGSADALFRALTTRQPVPYAAYLHVGDVQILSCSPELFFRRTGPRIVTRPMKGTAVRGGTAAEDDEISRRLASDEKNRAENLMIVDLLRNDLSRCCLPGSVRTPKLFETERYETLIQMSSEIEGTLRPGMGLADIFRALFPCGSITGAPKIRAMQRIDELEDEARGIYCGAVGFVVPGGDAVFNVAIRTAVVDKGIGRLGIGSGIVWDSEADAEFDECLLKAHFLTGTRPLESEPFYLIETMKAEDGAIPLLDLHLTRLSDSARHFGIPFDRREAETRIETVLAAGEAAENRVENGIDSKADIQGRVENGLDGKFDVRDGGDDDVRDGGDDEVRDGDDDVRDGGESALDVKDAVRIRLTLDESGTLNVERTRLGPRPERWRVGISEARVDSQDPLRRHKSSRRALYTEKYRKAVELGWDEVLFLNERGEVAEGARSNVFVRTGRSWRTPPVGSGALPGVYRRHLIDSLPGLSEDVLYIKDVLDADAVYFSNAVAGLVEAEMVLYGGHHHDPVGDASGMAARAEE